MLLEIKSLTASIGGEKVLDCVNLMVGEGEVHVLLGPNGAGKSTLLRLVMGLPGIRVERGDVLFDGRSVLSLSPDERAKLGIAMMYQSPPKLGGVPLRDVLREVERRFGRLPRTYVDTLGVTRLLERPLHDGYSGGEAKRAELLLTIAQRPRLALLDEPDSGVDVENLKSISSVIADALSSTSILIVTHTGAVLRYLPRVDVAHIIVGGKITCSGPPGRVLENVLSRGFKGGC